MKRMNRTSARDYVRGLFGTYYRENAAKVRPPTSMDKREFGFLLFQEGLMLRHKEFRQNEELQRFIESTVPSDVYYSAAYYERVREDMDRKGWLGADLIFDIDADHIQTACRTDHRYWICENCLSVSREKSEKCTRCGGTKFKEEGWLCENCLEAAKTETLKLIDFLTADFGFSPNDIDLCFSGQRGYHMHIENEDVRSLSQSARKEIADYVYGTGLKARIYGFRDKDTGKKYRSVGPDMHDAGWRGRLARGLYDCLTSLAPEQLASMIETKRTPLKAIATQRDALLQNLKNGTWTQMRGGDKLNWEKLVEYAVQKQRASIDTVVTTDKHRLIRLPTTLHGKTGLSATRIMANRLEEFDPLKDTVAFRGGALTIHVNESAQFRIGETIYGPYEQEKVELPLAAAVFLLCKEVAEPIE